MADFESSFTTRINVVIAAVLDSMREFIARVVNSAIDAANSMMSDVDCLFFRCRRWLKLLLKQAVNILSAHVLRRGCMWKMQRGQVYNKLKFSLGDTTYKKLKLDPGLTLVKMSYCQRSWPGLLRRRTESSQVDSVLEELQTGSEANVVKDLINHDFLILELQPGDSVDGKITIMASKTGGSEDVKAGIHVKCLTPSKLKGLLDDGVHLYSIGCYNTRSIRLKCVMNLLEKEGPDFCYLEANGWDYARNTIKSLLKECMERATAPCEKARLGKELDHLEANLRLAQIVDTTKIVRDFLKAKLKTLSGLNF